MRKLLITACVMKKTDALNFNEPEENLLLYQDAVKAAESPEALA